MYKKIDGEKEKFLCVAEGMNSWLISSSTIGDPKEIDGFEIQSRKASNSPTSLTDWMYWDGGDSKDGDIDVACAQPIVFSSNGSAAEWVGSVLGEYVRMAGEYSGRPYYKQRDTEGSKDTFLYYHYNGMWMVSLKLGEETGALTSIQDTLLPPTSNWEYAREKLFVEDDTSLKLEFTSLSPCEQGEVTGKGEVVEKKGLVLGDYRFAWLVKGDIRSGRFCVDFPERGFEIWTHQICIFSPKL